MSGIYLYNEGTKALHIEGFCENTGVKSVRFNSEREAIKYSEGQIYLCKICADKREQKLKEIIENERKAK